MAIMARVFRVALPLALIISFALPAAAGQNQSSTQLTITVSDPSGARVADAAVIFMRPTDERRW